MAYYPKSRIILGRTSNGEFTMNDGKSYVGPYYITFNGKYYTGTNPQDKNSLEIFKNVERDEINKKTNLNDSSIKYNKINKFKPLDKLLEPIQYSYKPDTNDYTKGKITRYFAKERKIRNYKIIEIDKPTFEDIFYQKGTYNYPGWDVISIFWMISDGRFPINFVENQNKRIIEIKNKSIIGLREYLTNLTQFSK